MANMKIELLVSTKVATGKGKQFVMAGDIIEVDEKTAKIMIKNKIAIDSNAKVVEVVKVVKDEKLIIENKSLIEELKTLKEANELMILEIEELKTESKK
tara:strand:- start:2197 stop:2493 length:297 start_codon:yes stop_codon:yes gene_type:complete